MKRLCTCNNDKRHGDYGRRKEHFRGRQWETRLFREGKDPEMLFPNPRLPTIVARNTRRLIPEDGILHSHRRANLISYV
jgi:hypothetical protein